MTSKLDITKRLPKWTAKKNAINTKGQAIKGFKLRIYWCWWILSATSTVTSCVIPARSKSAWSVFSFCVWRFANAYEKIKLKGEDYEEKDYFDSYCGNDDYYDRMWEKTIRITSWTYNEIYAVNRCDRRKRTRWCCRI